MRLMACREQVIWGVGRAVASEKAENITKDEKGER